MHAIALGSCMYISAVLLAHFFQTNVAKTTSEVMHDLIKGGSDGRAEEKSSDIGEEEEGLERGREI